MSKKELQEFNELKEKLCINGKLSDSEQKKFDLLFNKVFDGVRVFNGHVTVMKIVK